MSARKRPAPAPGWRNRIVGSGEEAPDQLLANPANWRSHPPEQRAALRGSLDTVGWVAQVMVNRTTGHVVDGHARIEEAISRGEPTVPVLYVELSAEEEQLVLATLDPIGALATAEKDALEALLANLSPTDDALRTLLAELGEKAGIHRPVLGDPDEVPPVPEPEDLYAKPGDLWLLGDHRLLCGDATNPEDVARLLDGAEPILLATDPPYSVEYNPKWREEMAKASHAKGHGPGMAMERVAPSAEPYLNESGISGDDQADWSAAYEFVPSLTVAYVWCADRKDPSLGAGLERIGFELLQKLIWVKPVMVFSRTWYHFRHEQCWVARRKGAKVPFYGERDQTTVIEVPSPRFALGEPGDERTTHPTQKPVAVMTPPLRNHLQGGEICYDPFLGSGTTLVAAETLGRRCYGMEIDPKFVQVTIERWQGLTGEKAERAG